MSRLPRIVVPGHPRHVTQRGNRRSRIFFEDGDYALYIDLLSEAAFKAKTAIWCHCLMPNHVHLIAVPSDKDGLRNTFAEAHRRYTGCINTRSRATGHVWQGRFGSVVMDENAVRYVSLNPVRAKLVTHAHDWPWSSVAAHLAKQDDKLVNVAPILERYGDFAAFLVDATDDEPGFMRLRQSETTGRPLGGEAWMEELEKITGKILKPQKRGPKTKDSGDE
jgi:putative transposase